MHLGIAQEYPARGKAPASVKDYLDDLARPLESIGGKKAKAK